MILHKLQFILKKVSVADLPLDTLPRGSDAGSDYFCAFFSGRTKLAAAKKVSSTCNFVTLIWGKADLMRQLNIIIVAL